MSKVVLCLAVAAAALLALPALLARTQDGGRADRGEALRPPVATRSRSESPLPALAPAGGAPHQRVAATAAQAPGGAAPRGELHVRVLDAAGGAVPLALVRVEARDPGGADRRAARTAGGATRVTAWTGGEGAVRFAELPPGEYDVHARRGSWREAQRPCVVEPGETARLEIVLEDVAWIHGYVLAPASAELEHCAARVDGVGPTDPRVRHDRVPVAADGTFTAGPLPEGRYAVTLLFPANRMEVRPDLLVGVARLELELGEVDAHRVPPRVVFDARGRWPASARVELRAADPRGWHVLALDAESGHLKGIARTDAAGVATLAHLPVGRHVLAVQPPDWDAYHLRGTPIEARAGELARAEIEVAPARGAVLCLDEATGAPLANAVVQVLPERLAELSSAIPAARRRTDAAGFLELELTPGAYRILCLRGVRDPDDRFVWFASSTARGATLRWTAEGSAEAEIALP